jgi:hypothetical protein
VWDLTAGRQVGPEQLFPWKVFAVTAAPDGQLVIGFDRDVAVLKALGI